MYKVYVNVRYKDTTYEEFIIESSMDAVDIASDFADHDNFIFVTEKGIVVYVNRASVSRVEFQNLKH